MAAVVTREHRRLALRAQGYEQGNGPPWGIPPGSDMGRWLETGAYPGDRPMGSDGIAQAIADAEARGRAESSAEVARLTAEVERLTTCWHCKASLDTLELPYCESCSDCCDSDGCTEDACVAAFANGVCADNRRPQANEWPVGAGVDRAGLEADVALLRKSLPKQDRMGMPSSRAALDRIAAALGLKEQT